MVLLSPQQQRSPSPLQDSPLEKETPSTPIMDDIPSNTPIMELPNTPLFSHDSTSLEEHVMELEFKLATLSQLFVSTAIVDCHGTNFHDAMFYFLPYIFTFVTNKNDRYTHIGKCFHSLLIGPASFFHCFCLIGSI